VKPVVDRLEQDFGNRVVFLALDAEREGRSAFAAYELRGHPSFVMIDTAGQVQWKAFGEQPLATLEQAMRQSLGEE
jgi:hypothetical protein